MRLAKNENAWPVVYHGNGVSKNEELFNTLKQRMREEDSWQEVSPEEEDITILTWSIPEETTILQESFAKMGIENSINVLPISKPFNWLDKIKLTKEFLEGVDTKYIMGMDATDVIVSTDDDGQTKLWSQLKNVFKELGGKLVFNAEKNNWPSSGGHGTNIEEDGINGHFLTMLKDTEVFEERIYKKFMGSDSCRLNSGCFFGETEYTKWFYNKLWDDYVRLIHHKGEDETFFGGDQGFIRIMQPKCFPQLIIDYNSKIFHTFTGVTMGDIDGIY